jgi:hypothetical protein
MTIVAKATIAAAAKPHRPQSLVRGTRMAFPQAPKTLTTHSMVGVLSWTSSEEISSQI